MYGLFVALALGLSVLVRISPAIEALFMQIPEGLYLALGLLFIVGYGLDFFAPQTAIPSFVWAIIFGMALQPPLAVLTQNPDALLIVVELLAAFVLFAGGVEVPFQNFKKYFAPIASISILGTVLTVFLFAWALEIFVPYFGIEMPGISLLVLAAILSSVDPTAIIPTLKTLRLKKPFLRDVAVSESAVNDVAGAIITRFFLVGALAVAGGATVLNEFAPLLSRSVLDALALEIIWGVLVGIAGAWLLVRWSNSLRTTQGHWSDPALFFSIPIFMFALGSLVGGSGFLAAFVAGLLYHTDAETKPVQHFFDTFMNGLVKPVIFILLGAVVPLAILASTVGVGLAAAFVFMFIIRPLVVGITLLPWTIQHAGEHVIFNWRDLLFLSFIRETGVIPAVLILIAVASGVVAADYIFAIGMWVILATLLLEPPLTPWLAKKLGVAK